MVEGGGDCFAAMSALVLGISPAVLNQITRSAANHVTGNLANKWADCVEHCHQCCGNAAQQSIVGCFLTVPSKLAPLMRSTAAMTMPSVASWVLSSIHISSADPVPCTNMHHNVAGCIT